MYGKPGVSEDCLNINISFVDSNLYYTLCVHINPFCVKIIVKIKGKIIYSIKNKVSLCIPHVQYCMAKHPTHGQLTIQTPKTYLK
jgi:hypothetical protein